MEKSRVIFLPFPSRTFSWGIFEKSRPLSFSIKIRVFGLFVQKQKKRPEVRGAFKESRLKLS
jgi:hypothetical protein